MQKIMQGSPRLSLVALLFGVAPAIMIATASPAESRGLGSAYRACLNQNPARIEEALAGCTRVIESQRATRAQYYEALVRRGAIRARQGDLGGAEQDLGAALSANANDARAYLALGAVKRRLNDPEGALDAFNAAYEAADASERALAFEALAGAGEIRLDRGEWNAAAQTYAQAIELSQSPSEETRALMGLGHARLGGEEVEAAIEAYQSIEGSSAEAAMGLGEAYRRLWARSPNQEAFAQAEAWYQEAIVREEGSSSGTRALQARAHTGLGELYLSRYLRRADGEDLASALRSYDRAVAANALDVAALTGRARARANRTGMRADAIADLDRALQLEPGNAEHLALRGQILAAAGDVERAMRDYDGALAEGGGDYETYFQRGLVYLSERDFARADQNFEAALSAAEAGAFRARGDSARAMAEALLMRSRAMLAMIDSPSDRAERVATLAVSYAERAELLQPREPRYAAASCLARAIAGGEWSLAQERCQRALQLALAVGDPRDLSEAHASTGFLRLRWALAGARSRQGEAESLEAAIAAFDRALAIAPAWADEDRERAALYRYARGVAHQCLARMGPAGRDMRAALTDDRAVAAHFSTYRIRPCTN